MNDENFDTSQVSATKLAQLSRARTSGVPTRTILHCFDVFKMHIEVLRSNLCA